MNNFIINLFKILSKNINNNNNYFFLNKKKLIKSLLITTSLTTTAASTFILTRKNNSYDNWVFNFLSSKSKQTILYAKNNTKSKADNTNELLDISEEEINSKKVNISPRKRIFNQFASVEYNGVVFMTPQDFIDSVTGERKRPHMKRKILKKQDIDAFLKQTPQLKHGSTKLFRNLENRGLITYSEYIFLLCVITKPKSSFEIAFNMFDIDGNKQVDKDEFLIVTKIFKRDTEKEKKLSKIPTKEETPSKEKDNVTPNNIKQALCFIDSTLLVHFFGTKGKNVLKFDDFKRFMENLQIEILEVEFYEASKGLNKLTELEFAEILLRYTDFNDVKKLKIMNKLESEIEEYSRGISFQNFLQFSTFMNNIDDFSLALKFHTFADKSVTKDEFERAVKVSSGFELDPQIVDVIFRVFDIDNDGQLSYKEFIAVMRDRLTRNPKAFVNQTIDNKIGINEFKTVFLYNFRNCMSDKIHHDDYYT